jgi:hypothetical protein
MLDLIDRVRKPREFRRLVLVDASALSARNAVMLRQFQGSAGTLRAATAVLDVMSKGLLAAVEIDGGNPLTGFQERYGNVHRGGRFARAALLVTEHNHMRGTRYATCCLKQHTQPLYRQ